MAEIPSRLSERPLARTVLHRAGAAALRAAFRASLLMPERLLNGWVNVAGGTPATRPGLDARARFHAWFVTRFAGAPATSPVEARQARAISLRLLEGRPLPLRAIHDHVIPSPGGTLRCRLYHPDNAPDPSPALIFLHFGGCVIGDLETCHTACTLLSQHGGIRVISVDYRLAPEHRFPAALDDTIAAFRWLRANATALGVDPDAIGIGGDSAGGYLAAAASLSLLASGDPLPKLQLLLYPVLEMDRASLPATAFDQCYPLTRADMIWFCGHYLRSPADVANPLCSVARAPSLAGMPQTLLIQARHDLLFDEGARFAMRLKTEGVPHLRRVYSTLPHAFSAMSGGLPAARTALIEIAQITGAALAAPTPLLQETEE